MSLYLELRCIHEQIVRHNKQALVSTLESSSERRDFHLNGKRDLCLLMLQCYCSCSLKIKPYVKINVAHSIFSDVSQHMTEKHRIFFVAHHIHCTKCLFYTCYKVGFRELINGFPSEKCERKHFIFACCVKFQTRNDICDTLLCFLCSQYSNYVHVINLPKHIIRWWNDLMCVNHYSLYPIVWQIGFKIVCHQILSNIWCFWSRCWKIFFATLAVAESINNKLFNAWFVYDLLGVW